MKENSSKKKSSKNTQLLVRYEGDSWSDEVKDLIEKDMVRARNKMTNMAVAGSKTRSRVQIGMISLASLCILAVWIKFNSVSKKLML